MAETVNLTNLREITGGDKDIESELFQVFLSSSDECMTNLRTAYSANDEAAWKRHAHAFKGIALNLGAGPLGELCKKAQEDYRATPGEKKTMLDAIETEFGRVRQVVVPLIKS